MRALRFLPLVLCLAIAGCDSGGGDDGEQEMPTLGPITLTYTVAITGDIEKATLRFVNDEGDTILQTNPRTFPEEFSFTLEPDATGEFFIQLDGFMSANGKIRVGAEAIQEVTPVGSQTVTIEEIARDTAEDVPTGADNAVSARVDIIVARVVVN